MSYFRVVFLIYCASYCCRISIQHLTPSISVHPLITSLMQYHPCFTVRRMEGGEKMSDISQEFAPNELCIETSIIYQEKFHIVRGGVVYQFFKELHKNDYKRFIPVASNGIYKNRNSLFKPLHQKLYILCCWSSGKKYTNPYIQIELHHWRHNNSLEYDMSKSINNVNRAVSPFLRLLSNSMILLKNPIKGYNNRLCLTTGGSISAPFTNLITLSLTGTGVTIQGYLANSNVNQNLEACKLA